jgi:hypothetical protein
VTAKRRLQRLLVVAALAAGACGSSQAAPMLLAPVPDDLVPPQLPGSAGDVALTLSEYAPGAKRIDNAGSRSMVARGRVFEVRRGDTLVGALQIATLRSKVDVSSERQRDKLASLIVSGAIQKIRVSGVEVVAAQTADKVVFLWFGDQLFEVLQVKGDGLKPEQMLKDILDFQKPTGHLRIRGNHA